MQNNGRAKNKCLEGLPKLQINILMKAETTATNINTILNVPTSSNNGKLLLHFRDKDEIIIVCLVSFTYVTHYFPT